MLGASKKSDLNELLKQEKPFFEPYGINISCWYMSNSYATLALRSTISAEIIEAFLAHDDIKIAYPTQTMFIGKKETPSDHVAHAEQEGENI